MTESEKKLILDALNAYKDDDNEEYNVEINQLIKKLSSQMAQGRFDSATSICPRTERGFTDSNVLQHD